MGFVALTRLRFGDGHIEIGEPVPVEPGRNYDLMERLGEIARHGDPAKPEKPVEGKRPRKTAKSEKPVEETAEQPSGDE